MAKGTKRISINALEKIAKGQFTETNIVQWNDIDVTVRRDLPLTEMLEFTREIVDACFLDDGSYHPEIMDFAIKSGILTHYANFTLPSDLEKQYWLIYTTGAADLVRQHIDTVQLNEIVTAAYRKLEYLCDAHTAETTIQLGEVVSALDALSGKLSDLFSGLENADLKNIADAIAESGLDEKKLVAAYLEQSGRKENGSGAAPAPDTGAEK